MQGHAMGIALERWGAASYGYFRARQRARARRFPRRTRPPRRARARFGDRIGVVTDDVFESTCKVLFGIAYRMLGSASDADDMVQETTHPLAQRRSGGGPFPRAFLSTIITRICLDRLKEAARFASTTSGRGSPADRDRGRRGGGGGVDIARVPGPPRGLTPLRASGASPPRRLRLQPRRISDIIGRDAATCRKITRARAKGHHRAARALRSSRGRFAR